MLYLSTTSLLFHFKATSITLYLMGNRILLSRQDMRNIQYMAGLILLTCLSGCGQSGALQLTNDPALDTRPKYLLWQPSDNDINDHKDSNIASKQ